VRVGRSNYDDLKFDVKLGLPANGGGGNHLP
jgi:hypothetical protein